jgi:hypothetical protein
VPVTYETDARHTLCDWWLFARPAKPWYTMSVEGTPICTPLTTVPRACDVTGMNGD